MFSHLLYVECFLTYFMLNVFSLTLCLGRDQTQYHWRVSSHLPGTLVRSHLEWLVRLSVPAEEEYKLYIMQTVFFISDIVTIKWFDKFIKDNNVNIYQWNVCINWWMPYSIAVQNSGGVICASWLVMWRYSVRAPSKAPVVSLSKKHYSYCLVLVGTRNGFERDITN